MKFAASWEPKAAKFLKKLPKHIAARILSKVDETLENPFHHLEHFEGQGYKLRIGDYRALVDIDFVNNVINIQILDNRGRIYKRKY